MLLPPYNRDDFSTYSDYKPPDRFPQYYSLCRACEKPFYNAVGLNYCSPCLRQAESSVQRRGATISTSHAHRHGQIDDPGPAKSADPTSPATGGDSGRAQPPLRDGEGPGQERGIGLEIEGNGRSVESDWKRLGSG